MMIELVLFDLDGTLVDSIDGIYNALNELLAINDFESMTKEEFKGILGMPLQNVFSKLLQKDPKDCVEYVLQFRKIYPKHAKSTLKEGALDLLKFLRENEKTVVLATVKSQKMADKILKEHSIDKYFDYVITSPNSENDLPKDYLIRAVLEKYYNKKEHAIMIGDTLHDIEGAKKNGIKSAGLVNDYCTRKEFEESAADVIVDSLSELKTFFK